MHQIKSILGNRTFIRKIGDILHPERESRETLAKIRKNLGEYNFVSQYQQNPTPPGGSMVKLDWIKYYEPHEKPARFLQIVQAGTPPTKPASSSDYSVCTVWGVHNRCYYLLHVMRRRMNAIRSSSVPRWISPNNTMPNNVPH